MTDECPFSGLSSGRDDDRTSRQTFNFLVPAPWPSEKAGAARTGIDMESNQAARKGGVGEGNRFWGGVAEVDLGFFVLTVRQSFRQRASVNFDRRTNRGQLAGYLTRYLTASG